MLAVLWNSSSSFNEKIREFLNITFCMQNDTMTKARFQVPVESVQLLIHMLSKQLSPQDTYSPHHLHMGSGWCTVLGTHSAVSTRSKERSRHTIDTSRDTACCWEPGTIGFLGYYPVDQRVRQWIQPLTPNWERSPSGSQARVQLFVYHHTVISGDGYMGHPFFLLSPTTDGSGGL